MRRFVSLTMILCVFSLTRSAVAEPPGIENAIQWLRNAKMAGGGWDDPASSKTVRSTAEALRALAASGLGNDATFESGQIWLATLTPQNLDDLARQIDALAGTNFTFGAATFLLNLFAQGSALPLAASFGGEDFWVDALSLRALDNAARMQLLVRPDLGWILGRVAYTHRGCIQWRGITESCV